MLRSDLWASAAASAKPALLALSTASLVIAAPAHAEDAAVPASADAAVENNERDNPIVVDGQRETDLASTRSTAPLLDTPQTITVVSAQTLQKQNLLTLRDALATVPGITFGAGEGGGGYGDSINLRGYSANNDITIDGVRDSAQYSRTDPFNLQQIEVYNGANSVFNGSGSVGGTINLVSKAPTGETLTVAQAAIGTDDYYRAAIDSNIRVSDLIAVRLNGMYHRNDVPGRDVERYKRWGVAPSVTIGIDGPTSLTLAYVHQRDDNTPIYGVPYFKSFVNDGPLPGADDSDYFGIVNLDEQETTVDRLTATFEHDFSDSVTLHNVTRAQRVHQYSQTSAPQGTFCLTSTGRQPIGANGQATTGLACPGTLLPGQYLPSGPRGLVRDQVNDLLINQSDLRIVSGEKGKLHNSLVVGASVSWEGYSITTASLPRNADGSAVAPLPVISIGNPNTVYTGPLNVTVTARSKAETTNTAFYAFDTLEIGSMFEINAGLRYEKNRAEFRAIPLTFVPPGTVDLTEAQRLKQVSDENLFSYRFGAVFKPASNLSFYAAYGNAKTPSSATVRLGCGNVVTSVVNGQTVTFDPCAVAPEKARSYEVGAKANLLDNKLLLTAALFRNERSNFRTPSNDPSLPSGLQVLDGRSRVDGIALGASGNITREWTIFANYTYLDSKVVQSVSDRCLGNPSAACLNSVTINGVTKTIADPQAGDDLIQTPKHSGSLLTTYLLPFGLQIGYGLTYQGSFALHQSTLLNQHQFRSDDYLLHRAFLSWAFPNGMTAQLNVQNLTNKRYYTGIRNNVSTTLTGATPNNGAITGGWATPGDGRSAVLSLFYSF